MQLQHYPVERLKNEILAIAGKHFDLKTHKLFFFGSRVTGRGSDRSDIDLGIEGLSEVPTKELLEFEEDLDNLPILYTVDTVDFNIVSQDFKEFAKRKIEVINE